MVASSAGDNCVASAEGVLPHDMRRDIRITGLGEVAVLRATDEATVA
jgi:hypothetical protein